jgi:hypothetical protein
MTFKISTGFRDGLLVTGSAKSLMDGKVVKIYAGTEPATADASIGAATLLVTVSNGGSGVTFEAAPVDGAVIKTASETWSGTNVATGTASFYRICASADAGDLSTSLVRVQGVFGGADGTISNPSLTSGATQDVDYCAVYLPMA